MERVNDRLNKIRNLKEGYKHFIDFVDLIEEFASVDNATDVSRKNLEENRRLATEARADYEALVAQREDVAGSVDDMRDLASEMNVAATQKAEAILSSADEKAEEVLSIATEAASKLSVSATQNLNALVTQANRVKSEIIELSETVKEAKALIAEQKVQIEENDSRIKAFNEAARGF